ncbi:MAG: hypothetical protein D3905_15545 [Candidatus Electrothrix sp. AS4_5]|nr:hypothetical protein [Candidatus Electrothrix gigas]MCI5191166.1 hypothetical protein [Candidatus Electrothrix gigas]
MPRKENDPRPRFSIYAVACRVGTEKQAQQEQHQLQRVDRQVMSKSKHIALHAERRAKRHQHQVKSR